MKTSRLLCLMVISFWPGLACVQPQTERAGDATVTGDAGAGGHTTAPASPGTTGSGGRTGTGGSRTDAGAGGASTDAGAVPSGDAAPRSVRFAVIGDFGCDDANEAAVADMVHGWNPDFVITVGDNNYPSGAAGTMDQNVGKYYQQYIGNYQGSYGPGSAVNRFWPALGNHDWVSGSGPHTSYFTLPNNERYYDVDYGLVHVFALDSQYQEPDGISATSAQANWLEPRLRASKACFDVVFFHEPPYTSSHYGPTTAMRWPFASWGADVVMSGHDHVYERLESGGLPYFVCGASGAGLYEFGTIAAESKFRYNSSHGAMLVTATATGITYEFWNVDGQRVDTLTVRKSCS